MQSEYPIKGNRAFQEQMPRDRLAKKRHVIEMLESRIFLSAAGVPDASFGSAGILDGQTPVSVRVDGTMVTDNATATLNVLNPDGTFSSSFSPPTSRGATSGKRIQLSDGAVSRFNADDSPDTSFGNGGTVSDLISGTQATSFQPQTLLPENDQILLAGDAKISGSSSDFLAIERLNANGVIDRTFGTNGIAVSGPGISAVAEFVRIDTASGNLLLAGNLGAEQGVARFGSNGQSLGQFFTATPTDHQIYGVAVQNDNKLLLLLGRDDHSFALYRTTADMTADAAFGNNGSIVITSPVSPDTVSRAYPGALFPRADGRIIVGGSFDFSDRPRAGFTFTFLPGTPDGSASISGDLLDESAMSGPSDAPTLPYWQVYADLNQNDQLDWGEPTAYADKNGHYSLEGLSSGDYVIREIEPPGWLPTAASPQSIELTVGQGEQASAHNFSNRHVALISGDLYLDQNINGAKDTADQPLERWRVFDDQNNDSAWESNEPSTTTDDDGHYDLTLEGGNHHVRAEVQRGFRRATAGSGYVTTVANGETVDGDDFLYQDLRQLASATATPTLSANPTLAEFNSVLAADRAAMGVARDHQRAWLRELQSTLHSDAAAYKWVLNQIHHAGRSNSAGQVTDLAAWQADLKRLRSAIRDDQQAITDFRHNDIAGLVSARAKLASDLRTFRMNKGKLN